MGKVRSIRLKESDPSTEVWHTPTDVYREMCSDSLEAGPFRARTDEDGFLITGNEPAVGDPIVFLGDSFVESMFVNEQDRFVSQVERLTSYRCLNAGYSGSTTLQTFNGLLNKVYPVVGNAGKVVFFVGQSDVDYLGTSETYWTSHVRGTSLVPGKAPQANLPSDFDATRRLLKLVIDGSRALGLDLVLGISPYALPDFSTDKAIRARYRRNREQYELVLARRHRLAEEIWKVAESTKTPLIDAQSFTEGNPVLFYDELHLNKVGHSRFAAHVAERLNIHY